MAVAGKSANEVSKKSKLIASLANRFLLVYRSQLIEPFVQRGWSMEVWLHNGVYDWTIFSYSIRACSLRKSHQIHD